MERNNMILYAVQNHEGKFLRSKGYCGSGKSWVDTLETAKIYGKIGPARGRVTWFANHCKDYPIPKLVALHISKVEELDETERIEKKKQDKIRRDAEMNKHRVEGRIESAKRELPAAILVLEKLEYQRNQNASVS